MIRSKILIALILGSIYCLPFSSIAQTDEVEDEAILDDLGTVTNHFQDHFFEALKQKGIENYDRALESLEKAAKESPNEAVVYFEMAKNQVFLKRYDTAEANYKKVLQMEPDKVEARQGLYDVYYNKQDYNAAIKTVKKLIPFDRDYKEDLANLYVRTGQYNDALKILDELDQDLGTNEYRNQLRQKVYSESDDAGSQITDLEKRIDRNPENEQDFLNLIYLYSEEGNTTAAFETAIKLLKKKPDSDLVHLALYKFYLEGNNPQEALNSMKKVLGTRAIDSESKFIVLNDFLLFVNQNPEYEDELETMVSLFAEESGDVKVYEQLGNYYLQKKMPADALHYFEMGVAQDPSDFSLIKITLLLQIEYEKYKEAEFLSKITLDLFPSQPLLFLLNGVANLNLGEYEKAQNSLENGLDYLIDDPIMEKDFYLQLSKLYEMRGNQQKSQDFLNKAQNLAPQN